MEIKINQSNILIINEQFICSGILPVEVDGDCGQDKNPILTVGLREILTIKSKVGLLRSIRSVDFIARTNDEASTIEFELMGEIQKRAILRLMEIGNDGEFEYIKLVVRKINEIN